MMCVCGGGRRGLLVKVVVLERIMKAELFVAAHKVTILEAIDAVVRQGVLRECAVAPSASSIW